MPSSSIWAYTWDLTWSSADEAIRELREDLGLDSVSVATSYHTCEMLLAHRSGRKFLWIPESAVYFRPEMKRYADTPIKPNPSPMVADSDPLRIIGEACVKYGLTLASWTVCLHNSHLATTYPDHAQTNAFGDVMPHALCASSPAVQAYMVALAQDLTANYPVRVMELESLNFQGYGQHHYHGKFGLTPGPVETMLFSLCFCGHCRALAHHANIDVDALQRLVQDELDRFCREAVSSSQPLPDYVAQRPDLDRFLKTREETVRSFTQSIVQSVRVPVYYYLMGDYFIGGMDYAAISRIVDRVVILAYTASSEQVKNQISGLEKQGVAPDKLIAGLQAYPPASPDRETLMNTAHAAAEAGAAGFCFYNYGIMPRKNLAWIKDALRGG